MSGYGGYNIRLVSKEFTECVNYLVESYKIESIVETGTFDGTGSTKVLAHTKKPVFTIECNDELVKRARNNLFINKNVVDYFLRHTSAENKLNKILLLDDIQHVKHYKSVGKLKALGYEWKDCGRFGYSILGS